MIEQQMQTSPKLSLQPFQARLRPPTPVKSFLTRFDHSARPARAFDQD
jgi:hypothetical protein